MADFIAHLNQARHNESCARYLLEQQSVFRDWAITAVFYAAIHLAEACFSTDRAIGHTETARDRHDRSHHQYRQEKISQRAPRAYRSYRKLREASWQARYLKTQDTDLATAYFSTADVRGFLEHDLSTVRLECEQAFGVQLH